MISPNPQPPTDEPGGSGGLAPTGNRDHATTRDIRLIEKLARRRDWNISDVAFDLLPNELLLIALNKTKTGQAAEYPTRERLSAARTIAHFNRQNQDNHPLPSLHLHAEVDIDPDSVIARMEAEAMRRGILEGEVDEGSNGNGKP
jgi:hypothetical protein